ncbi:BZ3500_MvSof-1268-A1-R1_Chr11-2g03459 [Microbotryum saponariae]|uniref:BZ3500_MvSof-1268-A1-R1_Chr11-2g03459 protein n=1 Tax=Microbotryum saponariae TaxID=289078 RepID=A0A2X0LES6_9BASI|nr:BZ3500_MvSof-1268-A1-R1_Chr11-2g03459 [Microbotryum saponariae]SDA03418.1 BZ3501_MvSof-1269-A2-R1_Chr11g03030 [Microbotryum saponariae]
MLSSFARRGTDALSFPFTLMTVCSRHRRGIIREGKTGAAIVNQAHFVDAILEEHHMANASPQPTPLAAPSTLKNCADSDFDPASIPYRAIVGKLLYLSGTTRPDIVFAVSKKAARFCNDFTAKHWEALKHILRYQKSFQPMSVILEGFVDADHGADPVTRRSVSGYVFTCAGGAISWIAKRQTLVTLSSTEAEYVAMLYAARDGIWLRRLLADLGFKQTAPTRLRGDNQSAITLAKHPAFHARTKHIGIHFHFIRDHIAEGTIEMVWVPTGTMAADVLTKGLGTQKHYQFVHAMGLIDSSREGASCARLFSEAWRCTPTIVFSPRLDYTLLPIASFTVNDVIVATLRCVLGKLLYTADKFSAEVYGPVVFKIMDHCYDGSYSSITGVSSQCVWTSVAAWVGHKELRQLTEARLRPPLKRLCSDLPNLCS